MAKANATAESAAVSDSPRRDLLFSLALISAVVVFALIGLATDRNWLKILRVSLSYATYAGILIALSRVRAASLSKAEPVPYVWFVAAGAAAGIVSGVVRPEFRFDVLIAGTGAAALLLSGVHCLALRQWRKLMPRRVES